MKPSAPPAGCRVFLDQPNPIYSLHTLMLAKYRELISVSFTYPVFLCIGSDRSTGDSLGPLVGTNIYKRTPYPVLGTLCSPVHAKNLHKIVDFMDKEHSHAFIVAIDASLGPLKHVGSIAVKKGPLQPGLALKKDLPSIGHMQILGLVNVGGILESLVLQSTRLHIVYDMAKVIGQALLSSSNRFFTGLNTQALR